MNSPTKPAQDESGYQAAARRIREGKATPDDMNLVIGHPAASVSVGLDGVKYHEPLSDKGGELSERELLPCPFCDGRLGLYEKGHKPDCYIILLVSGVSDKARMDLAWNTRAGHDQAGRASLNKGETK